MAKVPVIFIYGSGVFGNPFPDCTATLMGNWDIDGRLSSSWLAQPMELWEDKNGGYCFRAAVDLDEEEAGNEFRWGVRLTSENGDTFWGMVTEVPDPGSKDCHAMFRFSGKPLQQSYYLTNCLQLGANKIFRDGVWNVRFSVWAPNAIGVELVFGSIWDMDDPTRTPVKPGTSILKTRIGGGYIADDGTGIDPGIEPVPMVKRPDGIWETPENHPCLVAGGALLNHRPYMYRITRDDGSKVFRTDLYSRCQIGFGAHDPAGSIFSGWVGDLDGTGSCSVTVDPETVAEHFDEPEWPEVKYVTQTEFWKSEYTEKSIPTTINDLIIYELHMGALGIGNDKPGTIKDAIDLLDHIQSANFNAIELLPLSEFGGDAQNWGYATSHYFALEYSGGGRDKLKFFIRECHRRGIAVIMDVVYNHFSHDAERAEFNYDSTQPERNIYYWYEGKSSDYDCPNGGYVDNGSTAWAPRYHEEMVRKMFISSAVTLLRDFHVDGFRVDQTTSIHSYNVLHSNGQPVTKANQYGAKFLREFGRTMRLFKPNIFLMAEDHSDWEEVTQSVREGGMGFDASWYSMFYHHLCGDTNCGGAAKLLHSAALSFGQGPLRMDWFAGALSATPLWKVVYNESHDEAGNSEGPFLDPDWNGRDKEKKYTSHRNLVVAANAAPLMGETRRYAEARCRFGWGMTVLSAGIPLTLFGEEVGATKRFKYNAVLENKEDIRGLAQGSGAQMYRYYSDVNALRMKHLAFRRRNLDVVHVHNANRVIAFRRWAGGQEFLVVASLCDQPYAEGYSLHCDRIENGNWRELFNSDSTVYGGDNIGNGGTIMDAHFGRITLTLPARGFIVLERNQ